MDHDELSRLRTGVDRIEIHELLNRYAHAIDFMDWRLLEDVFTEDAVADYSSAGEYVDVESVREGRDRIIDYYETAMSPFTGVLHFMTNHLVELDGPLARTRSYMHVLNLGMGGIYQCRCRHTDAGWRIERLEFPRCTASTLPDFPGPTRCWKHPNGRSDVSASSAAAPCGPVCG